MSTPNIHISRAFVEFGPFLAEEIIQFQQRGLLREIDHLRIEGEDAWFPVAEWLASVTVMAEKPSTAPKPAAKTKSAAKSKVPAAKKAPPKASPEAKPAPKRKSTKSA